MRVLLLGGVEERFHQIAEVGPPLRGFITGAGHQCAALLPSEALAQDILWSFDAIVSITTGGRLNDAEERALLDAIATPTNYRQRPVHFFGLHGAACSFSNSPAYAAMLGGRFVSHPPMADVRVRRKQAHPVTHQLATFDIFDELYCLELTGPSLCLLAGSLLQDPEAREVPLAWTRSHGAGRVVYLALGHGQAQLVHPAVRQFVQNTLEWFSDCDL